VFADAGQEIVVGLLVLEVVEDRVVGEIVGPLEGLFIFVDAGG